MYPEGANSLIWVVSAVIFVWLSGITFFIWKGRNKGRKVMQGTSNTFNSQLELVLREFKTLNELKQQSLGFIQKFALKRYNPYQDTGGDQSFSAVWLDGRGDGIVITSLHSRSGTRFFAKPVRMGREDNFKFSEEEETVIRKAMTTREE